MRRRLVLAVSGAVLAFGAALPSHAATVSGCATVADARGDAQAPPAALFRPPATAGVDIHSVALKSVGDKLVGSVVVGDITQQPATSVSTRMAISFVLRNWTFTLFADIGSVPSEVTDQFGPSRGIQVFDELASQKVQVSVVGNTVSIAASYDELERLRGRQVRGQRLTGLEGITQANYAPRNGLFSPAEDFDAVSAPRSVAPVLGAACR